MMPDALQPAHLRRRLAQLAAVVAVVGIVVATFPGVALWAELCSRFANRKTARRNGAHQA
jgi:hypothetical protein